MGMRPARLNRLALKDCTVCVCEREGERETSGKKKNAVIDRDRARPRRNVECIWGVLGSAGGCLYAARARNWAQSMSFSFCFTYRPARALIHTATNTNTLAQTHTKPLEISYFTLKYVHMPRERLP